MLSSVDRTELARAFRYLQAGRFDEATAVAQEVLARSPEEADPLHMLALCFKARGQFDQALSAFAKAQAGAPFNTDLLGNHANLLFQLGRFSEARKLLEQLVELKPAQASAWKILASARRATGDLEGARTALRQALLLDPADAPSQLNLGVVQRLLGDPFQALDCFRASRLSGITGPEIDDAEASALLDSGNPASALELARRLTSKFPHYVPGHTLLAQILWEHGDNLAPDVDPCDSFRGALALTPGNPGLRQAFVNFLLQAGQTSEALLQVRELRARGDSAASAALEADVLERLGEHQGAARLYQLLYSDFAKDPGFLNRYCRHLLSAGAADRAADLAQQSLAIDPANQLALAFLTIAWRIGGDPREDWLCGYDNLVAELEVEVPRRYSGKKVFLGVLGEVLESLHTARRAPVNQSLRGGSQTPGVLFGHSDPPLCEVRDAIAMAVKRYLAALPRDASHPFLARNSGTFRFAGSWSVRLQSAGRHVNHMHQEGWLSSAFYVSLPESVSRQASGDCAGYLQLGVPPEELGLDLAPRRVIKPQTGHLVLFPSYLWHGTVPFQDVTPRVTIAFDALPS